MTQNPDILIFVEAEKGRIAIALDSKTIFFSLCVEFGYVIKVFTSEF